MSFDIIASTKRYLTDDVVGQVSERLGENPANTQTAVSAALPVVLNGLVRRSSEPGGLSAVTDLMAEVTTPNRAAGEVIEPTGGFMSQLSDSLRGESGQFSQLLSMGSGLITSLFGNKAGTITDALASHSGVSQSSASSVLSLSGPLVLSVLGQKMAQDDMGVSGLADLLGSQAAGTQAALPTGLAALLGTTAGVTISPISAERVSTVPTSADKPVVPPVNTPPHNRTAPDDSDRGNRWLPWLMLALGAIALFFVVRSCRDERTETGSTGSTLNDSANVASDANTEIGTAIGNAGAAADSAGATVSGAADRLGAYVKRKLPSGVELNITERGIESQLVAFIEDQNRPVDKETWFNFNNLVFDTGKATLRPDSKGEVENIAEVLKAYPNVTIKIGGYTDNTGNAQTNQQLSSERATTVLNELVQSGIDKSRVEAEGYGAQYPVAANDTEAGRQQNRRIAVRVTKK